VLATTVGGTTDTGTVTITNTGGLPTGTIAVTPLGAFTPTADDCTGAVLDPGQSCDLDFEYAPAAGLQQVDSSVLVTAPRGVFTTFRVQGTTSQPQL
jgi:hypothetical protein